MCSWIRVVLVLFVSGNFLAAFAQQTTTRSGFAIVTVVSGNIAGLIATESLKTTTSSGFDQVIVAPSTLVTTASMLVPVGAISENTTGLAITNPSSSSGGTVNLTLTDAQGSLVLNAAVTLGPNDHFSKFINELFAAQPAGFTTPLLLAISSDIPIAILGLNFREGDIAAIPITSISTPAPVPAHPTTTTTVTAVTTAPAQATPGFGLGLPPSPPPTMTSVSAPVTVSTQPTQTTASTGGTASLIFAQVATGGDWSTEIAVGNTSAGSQQIRMDFFGPDGAPAGTLSDIVIPSNGVFVFSTVAPSQP